MFMRVLRSHRWSAARLGGLAVCAGLTLALSLSLAAQQPAPTEPAPAGDATASPQVPAATPVPTAGGDQPAATPAQAPAEKTATPEAPAAGTPAAPVPAAPAPAAPATAPQAVPAAPAEVPLAGGITDEELKQMLVGKPLYLRGGYLDNSLSFDEHGHIAGHSPQGSYTLSAIQIDKVRLTKHKVELEGARYGLHFVGQLAYEDPSKAVDRVKITPKKKVVKITIDREIVVNPKKKKEPRPAKEKEQKVKPALPVASATGPSAPSSTVTAAPKSQAETPNTPTDSTDAAPATPAAPVSPPPSSPVATPAQSAAEPAEMSEADQLKASIAAAPEAERPADPKSVTTTISPAHATKVLKEALDTIFAQGLDERMMAAMPDFWKLYYQAVADRVDYRPRDPAILRQNTVDQKAKLMSTFEPDSNEFAQASGVAGMALYHTVIGADGKPGEIAVGRPIGFGLDENAVSAIRKASFQAAIKDGKPVPVLLDLVVQFRIFSKRTAAKGEPEPADKPATPVLPGPYSVQRPPSNP